jgi:rod shape determining protein RodA
MAHVPLGGRSSVGGGTGMNLESNPSVQAYLDDVCNQIKSKEVHADIREELLSHLEELVEARMGAGEEEEACIVEALANMGNAASIGRQFHNVHKPRTEWSLIACVLAFLAIGMVVLYGIGISQSDRYLNGEDLLNQKIIAIAVGLIGGAAVFFWDVRKLKRYSYHLYVFLLALLILAILSKVRFSGLPMLPIPFSSNWSLNVGAYSPWLLVLALAGILTDWDWRRQFAFLRALGLLLLPCMIYGAYSMWYLIEFLIGFFVLLIATRAPMWKVLGSITVLFALDALNVLTHPHLRQRWLAFLSPEDYIETSGYQLYHSIEAIKSAGWWGQGLGSTLATVPEIGTDFIFSYLVYSLGWIAGISVCLLVVFFTLRLFGAAGQIRDRYGFLVITGLVAVFTYEFFWNILMTMGLVPMTAVQLPFITQDGTYTVLQMLLLGVVLNIYRRKDLMVRKQV